jgi:heat shock protein HslJ
VKIIADHPITLTLEGSRVEGTAACNLYGGEFATQGNRFTLSETHMTLMGCRPAVMEAEYTYTAALLNVDEIERGEDTLLLRGPDSELHFELLPPVPTAELVGTEWLLESLIEGTGPEGIAIEADPARLMLHEDGTVSGTTGCRKLSGEWTERGNEILFSTFSADGNCSAARREQDDHVVNVLGDGFVPEIDGRTLWLTSRGGFGLHYRSAD